jgi:hypothetical protein
MVVYTFLQVLKSIILASCHCLLYRFDRIDKLLLQYLVSTLSYSTLITFGQKFPSKTELENLQKLKSKSLIITYEVQRIRKIEQIWGITKGAPGSEQHDRKDNRLE